MAANDCGSDDAEGPPSDGVPRLLVIDACNVSRSSCGPRRESVNCAGLLNVVRWLTVRDFEVSAFLPIIYKNKHNNSVEHVFILNKLHEMGVVSFTPARAAHSLRPALVNYDDLYVATMAERHGGCILSGDRFLDVLANPLYSEIHEILRTRVNVRFLDNPHRLPIVETGVDRLYKKTPVFSIDEGNLEDLMLRLYAVPGAYGYDKTVLRRRLYTPSIRARLLRSLDDLLDELAEREGIRPIRIPLPLPIADTVRSAFGQPPSSMLYGDPPREEAREEEMVEEGETREERGWREEWDQPLSCCIPPEDQLEEHEDEFLDGETLVEMWISPPL